MTAIDAVQHPIAPEFQQQGPDSNCTIDGKLLGFDSCTTYADAMLIDGSTAHEKQPSGCSIRRSTGDTSGGTTLNQVDDVSTIRYGVPLDVRVGPRVVSPQYVARQIRAGKRALAQGDAIALVHTPFRSTPGAVAHCVEFNEVRGGTLDEPAEVLVFDPAADGERHGWGTADRGPSWWPWKVARAFMAALRPSGPGTPVIGPNWCYIAFGPDTQPYVRLVPGAKRTAHFPDRARAKYATVRIHDARTRGPGSTIRTIKKGALVIGYQLARGEVYKGSPWWMGNDVGTEWIHVENLTHVGGET